MLKRALFIAVLLTASPLQAQDIVGLEDCSKARDADKKSGCLQSNVNFLHDLIRKNDAAAQARQRDATAKLTAASARIDELRGEVERLKQTVEQLAKKAPK
jgi:hypothetical protein